MADRQPQMDDDEIQEEGNSERLFHGIDGTMGDAQDVPHNYVESIHGNWCSTCGLARYARPHERWDAGLATVQVPEGRTDG